MKYIKNVAKQIHEILKTCSFDDVTDSSGYFTIKKFKDGTERSVDVYKSSNDGNPHYVIYCKYEDEEADYKYTERIDLQELERVLQNFYMEKNYININNMMKNELISVYDKIAKKMNLDFKDGFLDDVFETDYCITRIDLPECDENEIEICKMDWIHSKKDDFIYGVICELYPNVYHNDENYYEKYYDGCFQYLIDKTFKE